jgi:hypothetical protein
MTIRRPLVFGIAIAVGIGCFAFFTTRWKAARTLTLEDGRTVADLPLADTGIFGEGKFEHLRRRHLQHLAETERLAFLDLRWTGSALQGEAELRALAQRTIDADAESKALLERLGAGTRDDLHDAIALVFARLAGMPLSEYRDAMRSRRGWKTPVLLPEAWGMGPGQSLADQPEATFDQLYDEWSAEHARVIGVSTDPTAWSALIGQRATNRGGAGLLHPSSWTASEAALFSGAISTKAFIFHRWPEDWETFAASVSSVVQAEIALIVRTANGDRYPMRFAFVYDDKAMRWRLTRVFQVGTVRLARLGRLAF